MLNFATYCGMQEAIQILHDLIAGIDLELVTYFLLWLFKSNSFGRDSIDLVLLQGAFFSLMVLLWLKIWAAGKGIYKLSYSMCLDWDWWCIIMELPWTWSYLGNFENWGCDSCCYPESPHHTIPKSCNFISKASLYVSLIPPPPASFPFFFCFVLLLLGHRCWHIDWYFVFYFCNWSCRHSLRGGSSYTIMLAIEI